MKGDGGEGGFLGGSTVYRLKGDVGLFYNVFLDHSRGAVEVHAGCRSESGSAVWDEVTLAARLCTQRAHVTCNGRGQVQRGAGCSIRFAVSSPHCFQQKHNSVYIIVKAQNVTMLSSSTRLLGL